MGIDRFPIPYLINPIRAILEINGARRNMGGKPEKIRGSGTTGLNAQRNFRAKALATWSMSGRRL